MDAMFHNMVSERYGDGDFDPDYVEEDCDGDEEDLEASASENSCSSASQVSIVFGSFGDSVFAPPSPWIALAINGFTIKVGDIPCFLDDSCCIDHESAFNASNENQKMQDCDSELVVSAKSKNSTNFESEFNVFEDAAKDSKHLIIDMVFSCSGPVYGVSFFVGKQELALITINIKFRCFIYMTNLSSISIPAEIFVVRPYLCCQDFFQLCSFHAQALNLIDCGRNPIGKTMTWQKPNGEESSTRYSEWVLAKRVCEIL